VIETLEALPDCPKREDTGVPSLPERPDTGVPSVPDPEGTPVTKRGDMSDRQRGHECPPNSPLNSPQNGSHQDGNGDGVFLVGEDGDQEQTRAIVECWETAMAGRYKPRQKDRAAPRPKASRAQWAAARALVGAIPDESMRRQIVEGAVRIGGTGWMRRGVISPTLTAIQHCLPDLLEMHSRGELA
jgi:hypothetical protein